MIVATVVFSALFGLIAGSFVNVVALRIPGGGSVVRPRSACPSCGHDIRWHDNIPVVSWIALRGRCRDCGIRISVRYPVVESGTAALFATVPLALGVLWVVPAYLWFVGTLVALTITDVDHKLIPNRILFPSTAIGAVLLAAGALADGDAGRLPRALGGGAAYFAALFLLAIVARGGFGFGDVKLAFLIGLFTGYLGWGHVAVAGIGSFLIGGVLSLLLLVTRIRSRKDFIPFGPWMVMAALAAMWWGEAIVNWWLR